MNTTTHIKLSNGKLRARPGMGKTPWGLEPKRTEQIQREYSCPQYQLKLKLHSLYEGTKAYISHVREYARSGRKDFARRSFYHFEQSRVVEVLSDPQIREISGHCDGKISELKQAVWDFQTSCHPEEPVTYELEIHEIREHLREIVKHLPVRKRKTGLRRSPVTVTRTLPSSPATFSLHQANRHFAETAYRSKFKKQGIK